MIIRSVVAVILAAVAAAAVIQPASACETTYYRTLTPRSATPLPDAHRCHHPIGAYADDQWCLRAGPWRHVGQSLADALAEGGAPHADTRRWERCYVHRFNGEHIVACPMGYVELW